MARVFPAAYCKDRVVPIAEAHLSVGSAAVLYGLSVYTVFPVNVVPSGRAAFRLPEHYRRLINSARIIGIDTFEAEWGYDKFVAAVQEVVSANALTEDVFVRATVHVDALVPGTRSRGLSSALSIFIYEAVPILPPNGVRLKTSMWRRVPDTAIPSRAKVNGAYVNSVLGKQDALDSGYDDCVFLDTSGHVCELSAANIFLVRNGTLVTPSAASDILEGINRSTVLELAGALGVPTVERAVDVTELYIADEVFACGTSALIAAVVSVDNRTIGAGTRGPLTEKLGALYARVLHGTEPAYTKYLTAIH